MIARLLYAAVALCILGTRPEHAAAPSTSAAGEPAATASAGASAARPGAASAGIGAAPADFAIPRIER